eukprot:1738293-Pyramimonas_sp.AAC.1
MARRESLRALACVAWAELWGAPRVGASPRPVGAPPPLSSGGRCLLGAPCLWPCQGCPWS